MNIYVWYIGEQVKLVGWGKNLREARKNLSDTPAEYTFLLEYAKRKKPMETYKNVAYFVIKSNILIQPIGE